MRRRALSVCSHSNPLYSDSNVALKCGRYYNSKRSFVSVSTLVLRLKAAESYLETSEYPLKTQQCVRGEKSGLRDVNRADFVRWWRRSGFKKSELTEDFHNDKC